jgi:hypothetical protein
MLSALAAAQPAGVRLAPARRIRTSPRRKPQCGGVALCQTALTFMDLKTLLPERLDLGTLRMLFVTF